MKILHSGIMFFLLAGPGMILLEILDEKFEIWFHARQMALQKIERFLVLSPFYLDFFHFIEGF